MIVRSLLLAAFAGLIPVTVAAQGGPAEATDPGQEVIEAGELANGSIYLPVSDNCDLPEAVSADRVVVIGSYEGRDYSSVTVAGQAELTTHAYVSIKAEERIYLMLSSFRPMVWEIDGPVDRVVASSRDSSRGEGAGIVGVDPDRITFLDPECRTAIPFDVYSEGPGAVLAAAAAQQVLGVDRSGFGGRYRMARAVVGEASVDALEETPGEPRRPQWSQRVVEVDPAAVVSSVPAESYVAYPGELGVRQLRDARSIAIAQPEQFAPWMEGYLSRPDVDISALEVVRERIEGFYVVLSATHLPAPYPWYDTYMWLVPSGVSEPSEPTGDQCIFLMDGYRFSGPQECPGQLAGQ